MTLDARERGVILPGGEVFRGAPGIDPLSLQGAAPEWTGPAFNTLLSTRQEDWRGGRLDVTEFVPPAPDVAMGFLTPVETDDNNQRSGIADLLATLSFCATVTYHGTPNELPNRSGSYYWLPPKEGRHSYQLEAGELLVGRPERHRIPERELRQIYDSTDEHSADAHRLLSGDDELAAAVERFGWVLGLGRPDQQTLARTILSHFAAARTARGLGEIGGALAQMRRPKV